LPSSSGFFSSSVSGSIIIGSLSGLGSGNSSIPSGSFSTSSGSTGIKTEPPYLTPFPI